MKRICIDARFYRKSTAGVGRYTRGLIHHLQDIDKENDYTVILTPDDYAEWPKDKEYKNWHVKVMDIVHYSKGEQTELLRYLNEQKFDLVHFAMFNHPVMYKRPFAVTIHDLTMTLFPLRPLWHPRTWAYRYVIGHAAKAAKHVIAPSESTKRDINKMLGIPNNKITVTLEAVEPEFKPQHDKKRFDELKEKFGITKPFVLWVSAWRPHKGLPEMVKAFVELNDDRYQLLISSKPNPSFPEVAEAVEDAKQKNPNILTPGFISDEDIITLYSMASCFVFSSHYEGFGLGAAEAMACGCPVISAKNSSLEEVVGDAGLFYPTGDVSKLAEAVKKVMGDEKLQDELRQKGLDRSKEFSFDKMAAETLTIYKKAMGE